MPNLENWDLKLKTKSFPRGRRRSESCEDFDANAFHPMFSALAFSPKDHTIEIRDSGLGELEGTGKRSHEGSPGCRFQRVSTFHQAESSNIVTSLGNTLLVYSASYFRPFLFFGGGGSGW